jgi:hypothetical protein
MKGKFSIAIAAAMLVLAACSKPSAEQASTPAPAATPAPAETATAATGDPCTLVSNPQALFGQPVTAAQNSMPNGNRTCDWKAADGRLCGTVTVFGPGWNETTDVPRTYGALVTSMSTLGKAQPVTGIGEEATAIDGGILGGQLGFRTAKNAVLVGTGCGADKVALATQFAQEVASHL